MVERILMQRCAAIDTTGLYPEPLVTAAAAATTATHLAVEDHASTGSTQALVRGGCDNISELKGRCSDTSSDQAADVSHIHHQICANLMQQGGGGVSREGGKRVWG